MDKIGLLSLIADGEMETVEFKREMPRQEHLVGSLYQEKGDGLGAPRMIRLCRENGIREPVFTLVGDELVVIIYSREYEGFHD